MGLLKMRLTLMTKRGKKPFGQEEVLLSGKPGSANRTFVQSLHWNLKLTNTGEKTRGTNSLPLLIGREGVGNKQNLDQSGGIICPIHEKNRTNRLSVCFTKKIGWG